jgi:uncharacterized protein (TIGR04255 family)
MAFSTVNINLSEGFDHLSKAPIVEAILEFRARAEGRWQREIVGRELRQRLPDYPQFQEETKVEQQFALTKEGVKQQLGEDRLWIGLALRSSDRSQIAKFHRDLFSFSRLSPYTDWTQFIREGLRLWRIHLSVAGPSEIQRIGLRFINRIPFSGDIRLEDYLIAAPKEPVGLDLPYAGFLHHDQMIVPGHQYGINIVRTIEPPFGERLPALILDIDVFQSGGLPANDSRIESTLSEMRWLKNKAFFGSLLPSVIDSFR